MVPSNFTEPPRSEVSKVKWFTEGVSLDFKSDRLFEKTGLLPGSLLIDQQLNKRKNT